MHISRTPLGCYPNSLQEYRLPSEPYLLLKQAVIERKELRMIKMITKLSVGSELIGLWQPDLNATTSRVEDGITCHTQGHITGLWISYHLY